MVLEDAPLVFSVKAPDVKEAKPKETKHSSNLQTSLVSNETTARIAKAKEKLSSLGKKPPEVVNENEIRCNICGFNRKDLLHRVTNNKVLCCPYADEIEVKHWINNARLRKYYHRHTKHNLKQKRT